MVTLYLRFVTDSSYLVAHSWAKWLVGWCSFRTGNMVIGSEVVAC